MKYLDLLYFAIVGLVFAGQNTFAAEFLPVCERTPAVRDFLSKGLEKSCDAITEADLATIKRVAVPDENISLFKVGDFSGLPNLEILNITSNPIVELQEGLFAGLPRLKTLVVFSTKIKQLPDDFLVGLDQLENIHIFDNPFRTISESVFVRLAAIKTMKVLDFNEALFAPEKARLRALYPVGGPVELNFY